MIHNNYYIPGLLYQQALVPAIYVLAIVGHSIDNCEYITLLAGHELPYQWP